MSEIITLQFGGFANYVGTHFWNIQERNYDYCQTHSKEHDIESSILWRSDETNGNIKYTPRTVMIDLKDSKGGLNKDGYMVREKPEVPVADKWSQNTTTFVSDVRTPPSFDFTELYRSNPTEPPPSPQVEYWSDFLTLDFHPQSIFECTDYKSGIHDFDKYSDGLDFMGNVYEVEEITDKVRKFMEESNSPQGFQILSNMHDGFGAVAAGVLENMNDEFAKPSLTFGLSPSHFDSTKQEDQQLMINTSMSLASLSKESTVFVPVIMDWDFFAGQLKTHKENTLYHTSAVIAGSLDTATLNYRSFSRTVDFRSSLGILSPMESTNIASLSTTFPFEVNQLIYTPPPLPHSNPETLKLHPLIPSFAEDTVYGQLVSLRGVPQKISISTVKDKLSYLFKIPTRGANCIINQPFDAPKTFPCLLYNQPFHPTSVVTQLESSKGVYPYLHEVSQSFATVKKVIHLYPDIDYKEMYEELYNKAEGYASARYDD